MAWIRKRRLKRTNSLKAWLLPSTTSLSRTARFGAYVRFGNLGTYPLRLRPPRILIVFITVKGTPMDQKAAPLLLLLLLRLLLIRCLPLPELFFQPGVDSVLIHRASSTSPVSRASCSSLKRNYIINKNIVIYDYDVEFNDATISEEKGSSY